MSCPRLDEHLRSDLHADAVADLAQHTLGCHECSKRRATLENTRQLLLTPMPAIDRQAAAQWLADIEAGGGRPAWTGLRTWLTPALGVAAAATLAFVIFNGASEEPPAANPVAPRVAGVTDPQGPITLHPGQRIEREGLQLEALSRLTLTVPSDLRTQDILLTSGSLRISLEQAQATAVIETRAGRLSLEVGQYSVSATEHETVVHAVRGHARLQRGTVVEEIAAGQSQTFKHSHAEVGQLAPESAKQRRSKAKERRRAVRQKLHEARALLGHDDTKAAALADDVLTQGPQGEDAAEALMIAADARRRDGRTAQAQRMYAQVVEHPSGHGLAEEAALRRATLLVGLHQNGEALRVLQEASQRFSGGGLAPERTALLARLLLERGHVADAARELKSQYRSKDRVLDAPRIDVAQALVLEDRATALELITSVADRLGPRQEEAAALRKQWSTTK